MKMKSKLNMLIVSCIFAEFFYVDNLVMLVSHLMKPLLHGNSFLFSVLHKGPEGTKLPPTAQNRKELYEKKYGKQGTTVLSLETALQWKFNKAKDSSSPVMWPAIPIRMVYD